VLSKNNIKFINSLKNKKFRNIHRQFIVEGEKMVLELLTSGFRVRQIISIDEWFQKLEVKLPEGVEITSTDPSTIKKISEQKTPDNVLAIVDIPEKELIPTEIESELSIVLDDIRDPGNLGTIIRTADWFGVKNIICSTDSVDVYNPKVVQSTMGAIFRVNTWYVDLPEFMENYRSKLIIYGTYLDGANIYDLPLTGTGLILFGNESKGISKQYDHYVSKKLFIPAYNQSEPKPESLNLSISVAVVIAEFRRRTYQL
jgi:RNA methyltransferase, TrmH family